MQLAHNVQLPRKLGGAGGECIYIDTEGSFLTSRLIEIAKAHDVDSTLKGIHLFRVLDHTELIALIRQLRDIVQSYPKVKLIIIDSLAYHFRLNVLDAKSRGAILDFIARTLLEIAKRFELAVSKFNCFLYHRN
jgi:RAD51-like protein 2